MNITKPMIRTFNELAAIVEFTQLEYSEWNKKQFEKVGKKAFKELAKLLELKESKVSFNPGGIAVSGDLLLMGMWEDGRGIYVTMSKPGITQAIMYRTIKHMKDYTGGHNQFMSTKSLLDLPTFIERLKDVR